MGLYDDFIEEIDINLRKLDGSKQALFYLINGTRLLPLYNKFIEVAGLNYSKKMDKLISDIWIFLKKTPDLKTKEKFKDEMEIICADGEKYMIPEVANAQWATSCIWEAVECHINKKADASIFPCITPMYMSVEEQLHGLKTTCSDKDVLKHPKFIKEQKIIENYIISLQNDPREYPEIIISWNEKAKLDMVDPKEYE